MLMEKANIKRTFLFFLVIGLLWLVMSFIINPQGSIDSVKAGFKDGWEGTHQMLNNGD